MTKKDNLIGVIGHVDHGKTTLTAAIEKASKLITEVLVIDEPRKNPYASSMYAEYELIKQKKSKLNHNERKYIVKCVEC